MKIKPFISLIVLLSGLTMFLFLCVIGNAVSMKYEVFNPKETFYYGSLKTKEEKVAYVEKIERNNSYINNKGTFFVVTTGITLITTIGLIIFNKRIIRS